MIFGLFGGGGSSTPDAPKYETPDSLKPFLNYTNKNVFEDGPKAASFANTIYGAVNKGNLDSSTGLALLQSRLQGDSDFYSSDKFGDFLNYSVDNEDQDQIIQGAAQTAFYRDLDSKDLNAYKTLAQSMGKTSSPAELSNFIQQRMATTLEGQNKYLDDGMRAAQAYYGRALRDDDGNLTGEFGMFGMGEDGAKRAQQAKEVTDASNEFTKKYMKKLGAK